MHRSLQLANSGLRDRVIFEESTDLATAELFSRAGPDLKGCRESLNLLAGFGADSSGPAAFGWVERGPKDGRLRTSVVNGERSPSAQTLRHPLPASPRQTEGL